MAKFVMMLHGDQQAWASLPPEEMQAIMGNYYAWIDQLRAQGKYLGGQALQPGGRHIRTEAGRAVDGPYTETKETIGGYFIIEAADMEEATEVAKTSPNLTHGESVELRAVDENLLSLR